MALFWLRFRLMQKVYWLFCGINFTFLQKYYIWQLLTIGHDYLVPVDKQIYFLTEILCADRGTINMKHILDWGPGSDPLDGLRGWGQKVKIQLFQNTWSYSISNLMESRMQQHGSNFARRPPLPPDPGGQRSIFNFLRTWSCCISN